MESKEKNRRINLIKVIDFLLKQLNERERTVLLKRYGLKTSKKHTLEQIGKIYGITRERVRQIERNSIDKLKKIDGLTLQKGRFHEVGEFIYTFIARHGGVIEESYLFEAVKKMHLKVNEDILLRILTFIMHHLLDSVEHIEEGDLRNSSWKIREVEDTLVHGIVDTVVEIVSLHNEPITEKELIVKFKESRFFIENEKIVMSLCDLNHDGTLTFQELFISYMRIIKRIRKNIFEKWGLTSWTNVQPRKINDKAYLVLKKVGKPLHFTEIAQLINKSKFDSKVACAATVHNELILNDQYVLVGRGMYALKEWGYKEGTVIDVIYGILEKSEEPLTKDRILEAVLKTRVVKKSTVYLSLLNKTKFKKIDGQLYTINR